MAKPPAKTAKPRTIAKKVVQLTASAAIETPELKSFGKGDSEHPGFSFTRYWWEGEGPRAGITPWIEKKIRPGDDPRFGAAAKVEVMLHDTAPADYAGLAFLLRQFDEMLPPYERHVMIQVKLALNSKEPWHAGYERARAFARKHFVSQRFPVIMAAHVPSVVGLDGYGSHVHCIVLSRRVSINGLEGACHRLCSDRGYVEALAAWKAWVAAGDNTA
ncbi:hypothetical protein GRI75_10590 [Altererythrobacter soli]|uniref:Uncharacterized protein n=1 Tax=Croceibacterium soli TaxID=1739690 RepID=A0A6I4UXL5_9SPHN|nr:hypothetical protein [Croceibacterium soli]MXP42087.1 hypothetical protein [Croceibacterium soli]